MHDSKTLRDLSSVLLGEELHIQQKLKDKESSGRSTTMETFLEGRLPPLSSSSSVAIETFRVEYRRDGRGRVESDGSVNLQIDGKKTSYTVTQVIEFDELQGCEGKFDSFIIETEVLITTYDEQGAYTGIAIRTTVGNGKTREPDGKPKHVVFFCMLP